MGSGRAPSGQKAVRQIASVLRAFPLPGHLEDIHPHCQRAKKFSTCMQCQATTTDVHCVPPAAALTEKRSFVPGALKHAPQPLVKLLVGIKPVIEKETKAGKVFGSPFWSIVDPLSVTCATRL